MSTASGAPRGSVPVLTVTGARWESELVAAVENGALGVAIVRRCVDLIDLLAAATSGTARAVLLSADLVLKVGQMMKRKAERSCNTLLWEYPPRRHVLRREPPVQHPYSFSQVEYPTDR